MHLLPSTPAFVVAFATAVGSFFAAPAAFALDFTWDAPATCPSKSDVDRRLSRLGPTDAERTRADVRIHATNDGFEAQIATESDGRSGRRQLQAKSCDELTNAVVVVLSLLVRGEADGLEAVPPTPPAAPETQPGERGTTGQPTSPDGTATGATSPAGQPPDEPPAGDELPPPPTLDLDSETDEEAEPEEDEQDEGEADEASKESKPAQAVPLQRSPSAPSRLETRVGLGVGPTVFTSGPIELGGSAGAQVTFGAFGLKAYASYRRPLQAPVGEGQTLSLQSAELSALGCAVFESSLRWLLCAGPGVELLFASAPDVAEPHFDSIGIPQVVGGAHLGVPLGGRWSLGLALEGRLRTRTVHLEVAPYGRVLDLPTFGGSLLAGPELAF